MAKTVKIAACNFAVRPVSSFDEFAQHVRGLLDQTSGADLVLFPELFTVELFTTYSDWKEAGVSDLTRIDEFTDDYRSLFEQEAKERNQYIVGGSHLLQENGRYVNVGHLFEPDGGVRTHVKTHIFPAEADWSTEEGDRGRSHRPPVREGRLQHLLRGGDPGVRCDAHRAGRRDHPLPVVHVHRVRLLARSPLRSGQVHREPGVLRSLLHRRPAGRTAAQRLGQKLDPHAV